MNPYAPDADNCILVLDNARTHNQNMINAIGNEYNVMISFLPPYSYDYNPIEPSFHQAKQYIRTKWGLNVNGGSPSERFFEALSSISAHNCVNYFRYCGYTVTAEEEAWATA